MHFSRIKNYIRLIFGDKRIILLSVLIITAIPFLLFYGKAYEYDRYKLESSGYEDLNMGERSIYWIDRIEKIGAINAYEELVTISDNSEPAKKHLLGHMFGGILYETIGLDGFSVCDFRLQHGCIHEFVGHAITEVGDVAAEILIARCFDKDGEQQNFFCQHGIGHGLLSYFGYNENSLVEALNVCEKLSTENDSQLFGCYGGVFMEYNVETMLGGEGSIRNSEDIYSPCNNLKKKYLSACMFWQPQWWMESLFRDVDPITAYEKIGFNCENVSYNKDVVGACFLGMGNLLPINANLDSVLAVKMCDASSNVFDHRMLCRKRAGRDFSIDSHEIKEDLVCSELSEQEHDLCLIWLQSNLRES